MMFGAGLAVGLVIGAIAGVFLMAALCGGCQADDVLEQWRRRN